MVKQALMRIFRAWKQEHVELWRNKKKLGKYLMVTLAIVVMQTYVIVTVGHRAIEAGHRIGASEAQQAMQVVGTLDIPGEQTLTLYAKREQTDNIKAPIDIHIKQVPTLLERIMRDEEERPAPPSPGHTDTNPNGDQG